MAISILNNIASLSAENQLSVTQNNLQKTLMQLSSGQRINSGADDAAGLAIANGLEANVTALNQSVQNANDGVGQLQVADGALAQVTTLLNRAVTLATESANGSVSDSQRGALQAEYSQINQEIDQIGSTTNYNGTAVFTNVAQSVFLSDGVSKSTIDTTTGALSSAGLGLQKASVPQTTAAVAATATVNLAGSVNGGNPNNGETLTVGGTTYTFVSALGEHGVTAANDQVLIGNTASSTAQNLADAINGTVNAAEWQAGTGTAGANASVTATASGPNVTFTAVTAGAAENQGGGSAIALSSGLDAGIATASASGSVIVPSSGFTGGANAATTTVLNNNDLSTASDAQTSLTMINSAIASVASMRGTIGADINRLQAASNVATVQTQNLTSAEDGIMAADIPTAVSNLSQYMILNQSGISALAQANSAQQSILKLLS